MAVRMKVLKSAAGGHDKRVLQGSSPDKGIDWSPGDEITVTDDLAEKFERSGMAQRIEESEPEVQEEFTPEAATLETSETMMRPTVRRRNRVHIDAN